MKRIGQYLFIFIVIILLIMSMEYIMRKRTRSVSQITKTTFQVPLQVKGAIPYWDQEVVFETVRAHPEVFDYLSLFWYHIGADSNIATYEDAKEDQEIIDFSHERGIKVLAVITNLSDYEGADWDSDRVREIITNEDRRKKHIQDIADLLESRNFDGVNIDYEELEDDLRDDFSLFMKELSVALHKEGKIVGVALHPKSGENLPYEDNGSRAQDWEALAKYVDDLYIMAYGEHWDNSNAGPVASLGWVNKTIRYLKSLDVPVGKFYLGIPLYGYDWNKDQEVRAEGLTFSDVKSLLEEHDVESEWNDEYKSPYFFYEDEDDDRHEVWFENAGSVQAKIDLAARSGLGGVSFWRLGGEDPGVWESLENTP